MRATLSFNLPEDRVAYHDCHRAGDYVALLRDWDDLMAKIARGEIKRDNGAEINLQYLAQVLWPGIKEEYRLDPGEEMA